MMPSCKYLTLLWFSRTVVYSLVHLFSIVAFELPQISSIFFGLNLYQNIGLLALH